jgi:hypothetical protein
MQPIRYRTILLAGLLLLIFAVGGSCDHTRLTGEVEITGRKVSVGEPVPLKLRVPEELSGICRVIWDLEPPDGGEIIEGTELLELLSDEELAAFFGAGEEELNPDRIALFVPQEAGSYVIYVSGFYKQTNPQDITSIEVTIIP